MPTYYSLVQGVTVNKITKADYDLYVSAGIITQEQIENEAWIFTDDNFLSAENLAKLNSLDLDAIGEANVIEGVTVNGAALSPENKVINIVLPTKVSDLENDSAFITAAVDSLVNYYTKTQLDAMLQGKANSTDIPSVPSWAMEESKPTYSYDEITDKPSFSTVATSGSYNDLTDKPTITGAVTRIWNSGVTE